MSRTIILAVVFALVAGHFRFIHAADNRPASNFIRVSERRSAGTKIPGIWAVNSDSTRPIKIRVRYWTKYPDNANRVPHFFTATIQPKADVLCATDTSSMPTNPEVLSATFEE